MISIHNSLILFRGHDGEALGYIEAKTSVVSWSGMVFIHITDLTNPEKDTCLMFERRELGDSFNWRAILEGVSQPGLPLILTIRMTEINPSNWYMFSNASGERLLEFPPSKDETTIRFPGYKIRSIPEKPSTEAWRELRNRYSTMSQLLDENHR